MKPQIVFSKNVWKKLDDINTDNFTLLLGWERKQSLSCIGCAKLPQDWDSDGVHVDIVRNIFGQVPCGLKIIGLYCCSKDEAIRNDCKSQLDKLIAPEALENLVADSMLVYVWKRIEDTTISFLYDTESEMIIDAGVETCELKLQSEMVSMRVTGTLPLCFDLDNNLETTESNVLNGIENVKKKVTSAYCTFHLANTTLLLHNLESSPYLHVDLDSNCDCGDLMAFASKDEQQTKKNNLTSAKTLKFKMMFSMNQPVDETKACVPVIRYERRSFEAVTINLCIDVMASVLSSLSLLSLPKTLSQGICCQLDKFGHSIIKSYQEKQIFVFHEVYHFMLPTCDHLISVVYPKDYSEKELEASRKEVHQVFYLPMDKPLIRRSMCSLQDKKMTDGYLRNVHVGVPPSRVEGGITALVYGSYSYHHYMQDNFNDDGWGCAYRSLQTVISWFKHQGYTEKRVPSHVEIQKTLVELGDKPATFINSRQWIGSMEVGFCLESLLGITSKFITVNSGSELAFKGRELVNHFNIQGTPIMIGGGTLAHTILGVDVNFDTGDIKFLILDPHYTGSEDIAVIQKKGWCGWKGVDFWNKTAYYNLCCPIRPSGI